MEIRINKYLSQCGIASRRKLEAMLWDGEFQVNGQKAIPGQMIDTEKDTVTHLGRPISAPKDFVYIALNKPLNTVSSTDDEMGRTTVMDIVKSKERLYPVGRLDKDSTGLILLTNDGDLALKLTHPRYHLPKTYEVSTQEAVFAPQLEKLKHGVRIMGTRTLPATVERTGRKSFRITIHQGMNRQIRKMCNEVHLTIKSLKRVSIGSIQLGDLAQGAFRNLKPHEVEALKAAYKPTP
jgi:23S rRNA pseudouridine2605 synthase